MPHIIYPENECPIARRKIERALHNMRLHSRRVKVDRWWKWHRVYVKWFVKGGYRYVA